jgi:hypothetical protein
MAESSQKAHESWSDGMSKLVEAGRANMTAYNLAAAGVVALAAGATAYFWDQTRRNAFLDAAERYANQMRQAWGLHPAQSTEGPSPPSGHA